MDLSKTAVVKQHFFQKTSSFCVCFDDMSITFATKLWLNSEKALLQSFAIWSPNIC